MKTQRLIVLGVLAGAAVPVALADDGSSAYEYPYAEPGIGTFEEPRELLEEEIEEEIYYQNLLANFEVGR